MKFSPFSAKQGRIIRHFRNQKNNGIQRSCKKSASLAKVKLFTMNCPSTFPCASSLGSKAYFFSLGLCTFSPAYAVCIFSLSFYTSHLSLSLPPLTLFLFLSPLLCLRDKTPFLILLIPVFVAIILI